MVLRLSHFANQLLTKESALKAALHGPVLLWEAAPQAGAGPSASSWELTDGNARVSRPVEGEPVVFEVKKAEAKQNAFAMGITVGRTENNDIAVDDSSVSRFHAYFQQDLKTHAWKLVDAESSNGTSVGAMKLTANVPTEVADQSRLRFGSVEMRFMTAESFLNYLREILAD